jgi:hypothetical protein
VESMFPGLARVCCLKTQGNWLNIPFMVKLHSDTLRMLSFSSFPAKFLGYSNFWC